MTFARPFTALLVLVGLVVGPASAQRSVAPVSVGPVSAPGRAPQILPTRLAAECVGVLAPEHPAPDDTTWHPAVSSVMVIPPAGGVPSSMLGTTVTVTFLINALGAPDSVDLKGNIAPAFAPKLRAVFMKYQFRAAIYQGCAVRAWGASFRVTFDKPH